LRAVLLHCLLLALLAVPGLVAPGAIAAQTPYNDWQEGNIVYLARGTQIRQGPGLDFCYHTIVPENDWAVKVTAGPTFADGRTWYDTSRMEAGDPPGGTGWVNVEQANLRPAPDDGGTLCPGFSTQTLPTPTPTAGERAGFQIATPDFLLDLKSWWVSQSIFLKVGVLVAALALFLLTGRWAGKGAVNATLFGVIRAGLVGIMLAGLADLTRTYWQSTWLQVAGGASGLDPALILLVIPIAWVVLSFVLNTVSRVLGLVLLAIQVVLTLAYLAPDRFNGLLDGIIGAFTGGR
jgi:hypothetical protein